MTFCQFLLHEESPSSLKPQLKIIFCQFTMELKAALHLHVKLQAHGTIIFDLRRDQIYQILAKRILIQVNLYHFLT